MSFRYVLMALAWKLDSCRQFVMRRNGVCVCKERDASVIITQEGCVEHGYRNPDNNDNDWMWKSSSDGTNHRPRNFFVANASGKKINVQFLLDHDTPSGRLFVIKHKGIKTVHFGRVKITFKCSGQVIYQGPVKPRTSIIVCSAGEVKTTGRLYGEDIEAQKWIVDGRCYKPKTLMEKITTFGLWIGPQSTVAVATGVLKR